MEKLERASASACQVNPSGITKMYEELSKWNVHSVMVTRENKVIAEGWWKPYKPEYNHIQYSVSKSFVGTAIGVAVSEGILTVEDRVLEILGEILPSKPCENMQNLTIKNILTMSTGHKDERNMFREGESWAYSLLASYIDEKPGEEFRYISSSTYLLCAVIWKLTGQTVFEYLKPRLFEPMGFSENIWWETSPEDLNTGFNGFNATAEDITKLALLYLNKGRWKGRQILSEEWINQASDVQIDNSYNEKNQKLGCRQGFGRFTDDWKSGYGYLFWHCKPEKAYRGDGIYGQMCIILPEQGMTVAVAAGCSEPDKILDIIWRNLLPAVNIVAVADTLGENLESYTQKMISIKEMKESEDYLTLVLGDLKISTAKGRRTHPEQEKYSDCVFEIAQNGLGVEKLMFSFLNEGKAFVTITTEKGVLKAEIGFGEWIETESDFDKDGFSCDNVIFFSQLACSGAWQEDEYVVKFVYTRTPFVDTMRVRFGDGKITGNYIHTVKYGSKKHDIMGICS